MSAKVYKAVVFEDGGATFLARITGHDALPIVQASLSGNIIATILNKTTSAITSFRTQAPATLIFDTLQTDPRWEVDAIGYNFRDEAPASAFPDGDQDYVIEYKLTPAGGAVFWLKFEVNALPILSS